MEGTERQNNNEQIVYAGFWIRAGAALIDGLIINIIMGILVVLFTPNGSHTSIFYSLIPLWIYEIVLTYYFSATLGKMAMGIKVVSNNLGKISFIQVLLRETIGKFLSSVLLMIGFIMIAFDGKKQGLHDKIARSLVIKEPTKKVKKWILVLAILLILVPSIIGFVLIGAVMHDFNLIKSGSQISSSTSAFRVVSKDNGEVIFTTKMMPSFFDELAKKLLK